MSEQQIPAVEVPEAVKVEVEYRLPIREVQKGDLVAGSRVAIKRTGPKWTVLETADEKRIVRLENDVEIPVVRIEETPESRKARQHAMLCERVVESVNGWTPKVPAVLAKMQEQTAKGYAIGYSELGSLATAQAEDKVWGGYVHAVRFQMLEKGETDAVAARQAYVDSLKDRIVSAAQYLSNRSSNAYSNLLDDEEITAMAQFVERGSWWY